MSAIITTNLTKTYGDIIAVDRLSLSIEEGELFSLLGVNGAGKTTTIKMLSCLIKPTSGDAVLLGDSVRERPQSIKEQITLSPQETAVAANLSVQENLALMAGIYSQSQHTAEEGVDKMIAEFGLEAARTKKARTLSGGVQRRLSIAMALITNPRILFLDEPTLGLDVLARRELWASIRALKGRVTIILTTHYLEEAEALADRVGIMANGRLTAIGTVTELMEQTGTRKLEDAFVTLAGGAA